MANRKLTFTLPEDLAAEFLRRIPSSNRSSYVATAIRAKLREREEQIVRSCEVANSSADVRNIEESWDSLTDEVDRMQEPW